MINVAICQGYKEEYIRKTGYPVKEQINIYKHPIRQSQYQQLVVGKHFCTCADRMLHMLPFSRIFKKINH